MAASCDPPCVAAAPPTDEEILAASRALGGLAPSAAGLWRELSDPEVDPRRLHAVLHQDPGIAARVLKVANSAFYGRGRQIATLEQAVIVLGIDAVRGIAAAAGLDRVAARAGQAGLYVAHCVAVAGFARELAARTGAVPAGEAFLAGLLHDFGLLVEWRLLACGRPLPVDPLLHLRCGRVVLTQWQLPTAVVDAAASHHLRGSAWDPGVDAPLCACVRLAHCAAGFAGVPTPEPQVDAADAGPAMADMAVVGMQVADWEHWLPDAASRSNEATEALCA
jgi:HD-like signal output (HDOD) protein